MKTYSYRHVEEKTAKKRPPPHYFDADMSCRMAGGHRAHSD
ncbi:MAG: hypothetical protein ACJAVT_002770 [Yoonia sp.]|jgi:hypothetical protein